MKCDSCLSLLAIAVVAFSPFSVDGAEPQKPEVVEITLHPAAVERPSLKYRLQPTFLEEQPGNAATTYMKAFLMLAEANVTEKDWDNITKWATTPPAEFPRQEARKILDRFTGMLDDVAAASLCKECEWETGLRDSPQPLAVLLPELKRAREVARLLSLKARLEIAGDKLDAALATIRVGFSLARHVAEQPTVLSGLVGTAIATLMMHQLETLVQHEDAPNLYWSLTTVPTPVADLEIGLRFEEMVFYVLFPQLTEVDNDGYTKSQWDRMALEMFAKARATGPIAGDPDQFKWLMELKPDEVVETQFPASKKRMLERGYAAETIDAMPKSRVVLLDFTRTYEEYRDEFFKWYHVPYWQARDGHAQEATWVERAKKEGLAGEFAVFLLPTVKGIHAAETRGIQHLALLRTIEAVRNYAATHDGRIPKSLAEITDVPIPDDPFTGNPFGYRLEDGAAVIDLIRKEGTVAKQYRLKIAE